MIKISEITNSVQTRTKAAVAAVTNVVGAAVANIDPTTAVVVAGSMLVGAAAGAWMAVIEAKN